MHMTQTDPQSEQPETISKTEARQARPAFTFRVLIISIVVIAAAFVATYLFGEATDNDENAVNQQNSENVTAIEPPPNVPPAE